MDDDGEVTLGDAWLHALTQQIAEIERRVRQLVSHARGGGDQAVREALEREGTRFVRLVEQCWGQLVLLRGPEQAPRLAGTSLHLKLAEVLEMLWRHVPLDEYFDLEEVVAPESEFEMRDLTDFARNLRNASGKLQDLSELTPSTSLPGSNDLSANPYMYMNPTLNYLLALYAFFLLPKAVKKAVRK